MALPTREYFYLKELAKRWSATELDVQYYIENNLLNASVWLWNVNIEIGHYESISYKDANNVIDDVRSGSGLYVLRPNDCRHIFRRGSITLKYLSTDDKSKYCKIIKENGIELFPKDIVITHQECCAFEKQNSIYVNDCCFNCNDSNQASIHKIPLNFKQECNFNKVEINGITLSLGPVQANVVRLLYDAHMAGSPWLYGKEILYESKSETTKMVDLFKRNNNWRRLIISDGKGRYRLNL